MPKLREFWQLEMCPECLSLNIGGEDLISKCLTCSHIFTKITVRCTCYNPTCPGFQNVEESKLVKASSIPREGKDPTPRFRCVTCKKQFPVNYGTPYYRLRYPPEIVSYALHLINRGKEVSTVLSDLQGKFKAAVTNLDTRAIIGWVERRDAYRLQRENRLK